MDDEYGSVFEDIESQILGNINYLDYLLNDFIKLGFGAYQVIVPDNYPVDLIRRLNAATKSFFIGTSIGYTYDHYFKELTPEVNMNKELSPISQAITFILHIMKKHQENYEKLTSLPEVDSFFAAEVSLIRLESSFKSACMLLKNGLAYEASAITKVIIEQTCWALCVYNMGSSEFMKIQPSQTISRAKEIFPYVGALYGKINENSHMSTKVMLHIPDFEKHAVKMNDFQGSIDACTHLLCCLDMYETAFEWIYFDYYKFGEMLNTDKSLKNDRETIVFLKGFSEKNEGT